MTYVRLPKWMRRKWGREIRRHRKPSHISRHGHVMARVDKTMLKDKSLLRRIF